jgi:glucose-6-phosphate 1-epimerase
VTFSSLLETAVLLEHPSGSTARVARHGAHVVSWTDATGRERLYLSRETRTGPGASIRGGIPVIFPQFAAGPLPRHGFVRTRDWSVIAHQPTSVTLRITDDDTSRALWPHRWTLDLHVELGETLAVRMHARNTGDSAFDFQAALHNYFLVDDIATAAVRGLAGVAYHDRTKPAQAAATSSGATGVQRDELLAVDGEIDRVYVGGPRTVAIEHAIGTSSTQISADGFGDWVVWNPWREGAAGLSDMPADDYRRMLCVEAARVESPIRLEPTGEWIGVETMTAT